MNERDRQSQFELLRLVAMLLVLVVHADYYSLDPPTTQFAQAHPGSAFMRMITESFALVCVNVYILISGYFGIRLRWRSVLSLLFMIVFWRILVSATVFLTQVEPVSLTYALKCAIPTYRDWFVTHYLLLMLVAPLLNRFIERQSTRSLLLYALAFTVFQWIFSWSFDIMRWFRHGNSVFSFAGLYVIGACMHRLKAETTLKARNPIAWYAGISLAAAAGMFAVTYYAVPVPRAVDMFMAYNGVNVMLGSVALFLVFERTRFTSATVNSLAGSAFAVYLMHMHPLAKPLYKDVCLYLYNNFDLAAYLLFISLFIVGVFATAIAIDRVRRLIWQKIANSHKKSL